MRTCQRIRLDDAASRKRDAARRATALAGWGRLCERLALLSVFVLCAFSDLAAHSQTFRIASATYSATATSASTTLPAGVDGAPLTLTGTLPTLAQQTQLGLQGCFYTGYGSTAGIPLSLPNGANTEPLTVPYSTIQSIPSSSFTAANNYTVTAEVYFVANGQPCNGTFDNTLTNQYPMQIVAPSLGTYSGPSSVPQTNSATGVRAAPTVLTLPANGELYNGASGGTTAITFGSFGSVPLTIPAPYVYLAVPAAFSSAPVGSTASLSICNSFPGGSGGTNTVCTTPTPAINLTVAALAASTGTILATPTPVSTSGQTILTAQFVQTPGPAQSASAGAPSGTVSFAAGGNVLPAAKLVLDKTATFTTQTATVTTPTTATPFIAPKPGSYASAQTVSITDATTGAAIYFTQDGSTPTTASALYTGPFTISTTQTIQAIAAAAGDLNSAVASSAYTINIPPPTQLAFAVQPVNTLLNAVITPPVQVAVENTLGNVVTTSSAAVTLTLYPSVSAGPPVQQPLGGTTTVNAVNGIATFSDLTVPNVASYILTATSGTLQSATSNAFNITPPPITITLPSALVGIASTLTGSFTLGAPAPSGGAVVSLTSSTPANVTISPASVTVAAGQTTGSFTYTGVAAGPSTLSASATNYQTGTATATGTAAQVSLGVIPAVAPGQTVSLALSLATPAPAGGTTVSFTIANPNIATVTSSVFVPAGLQTPTANPQVSGVLIGSTTVTATAPGYAPATRTVNVTVTATVSPAASNINLSTSTNTRLNISAPAPAGGITFTLSSDTPTIATVAPSVTVIQGATSVAIPITGVLAGSTTIRADSPGITEATGTVNVSSIISGGSVTTGFDLENTISITLPVAPPNPVTVTVTTNNPAVATISNSASVAGQTTIVFPNVTSTFVGTVYVQGQSIGSTTLSISAPGYTTGSTAVTVDPTGFAYSSASGFTTTTFSNPTAQAVYTAVLAPGTGTVLTLGLQLNPGSPNVNLPITSSLPSVGTVTSPLVYTAGSGSQNLLFQPVGAGTSNLTLGTPPTGFNTPTQFQQIVATVNIPAIVVSPATTGVNLQTPLTITLPVAPPTPVTVTVSVPPGAAAPTAATISNSQTVVGGFTLTFTNVSTTTVGTIYVQGQLTGSTTLTVSAPGYTNGTSTLSVLPSGFIYDGVSTLNTTTFSAPTAEAIYTAALTPNLTAQIIGLALNPAVGPVTVTLNNSVPAVGTVTPTSVVFNTGDSNKLYSFQPTSAGSTNITLGTPSGFSTPSQYQQLTATVTAPQITVSNLTTGVHLQNTLSITLPVAPPSPVTVTVTSGTPASATLSNSQTVAGVTTVTFSNVTSTFVGTLYVQGQSLGTSTLTVSAPGYTSGTGTATVQQSGFLYDGVTTLNTTTFSAPTVEFVYTSVLNANLAAQIIGLPVNPGSPITVPLTDSAPTIGTITPTSVVFNAGNASQQFSFQPVSAGSTNITIGTPAGFSTPSQYQQLAVTVTAPQITVGNPTTGLNLEVPLSITLPVAPPNPIAVTVTTNGPAIATLSNSATVAGGSTLVFSNVTSTFVGTIYVQGQSVNSTTITVSAPGYSNGNGTVTVDPSGFAFASGNFTTTATSAPTALTIYAASLNPGSLTVLQFGLQLNPGIGNISVPVVSATPSVGTITVSPVVFAPGTSSVNTSFQPVASGSSVISVQTPTGFSTPSQNAQVTGTVQ